MKQSHSIASWQNVGPLALASFAALAITSCQLASPSKVEEAKNKAEAEKLYPEPGAVELSPEAKAVNDAARLLAGLPALPDQDSNKQWRSESYWKAHKIGMEKMWTDFGAKRGIKVRKWASTEVADVQGTPVVFQPFGGPDFVFSHLLFPNAETFVVCGAAPCIDLPKFDSVPADVMADTVFALREATASCLKTSGNSGPAVAPPTGKALKGALPMLLAMAARTGHIVEGVELMPTDESAVAPGQIPLDPAAAEKAQASRAHPSSACVISLRTGDGKPRRLFYFQQHMTDEGLPESAALLQYLNKQSRVAVVVNESSHELHQLNTLRLQQYIARHAVAIVQDPTGVPYRHFNQESWNIQRYGSYSGAPPEQRVFEQPELIAAYNDNTSRPQALPFGRGRVDKETPAALMIARPLVANTSDLPVNVEVTPLPEPGASEPPPSPAAPMTVTSVSPTPASPAPAAAHPPVIPPISPVQEVPSAVEASLGVSPLAPIELNTRP